MPSNEIHGILKDKKGFVWIGTDKGLCRSDGKKFKVYPTKDGLVYNAILEIKEDKKGRIW